jgi:hypothetical protein
VRRWERHNHELGADALRLVPGSTRREPLMAASHALVLYDPQETSEEVRTAAGFLAGYSSASQMNPWRDPLDSRQ